MTQNEKDLCKTCDNYWEDFVVLPIKQYISHCSVVDKEKGLGKMEDVVPYPCIECPFNSYIKKTKYDTGK